MYKNQLKSINPHFHVVVNVKMQDIDSFKILKCDLMVIVDIKILQEVLNVKLIDLVGHVEVLEDKIDDLTDL